MKNQISLQISLLVLTFSTALAVFGRVALFPANAKPTTTTTFTFPAQIPLTGWQLASSQPLLGKNINDSHYVSGNDYRYSQGSAFLTIEMRYFANTNGDVKSFLRSQTVTAQSSNQETRKSDSGYYYIRVNQETAHLSACINPYGGSTVTSMQFKQNRNTYDISERFIPWLLGRMQLQDNRCLWAHLSLPLNQQSSDVVIKTLEGTWESWYQWWKQHFPSA